MKYSIFLFTLLLTGCVTYSEPITDHRVHVYSNIPSNSSVTFIRNEPVIVPQPYPYYYRPIPPNYHRPHGKPPKPTYHPGYKPRPPMNNSGNTSIYYKK